MKFYRKSRRAQLVKHYDQYAVRYSDPLGEDWRFQVFDTFAAALDFYKAVAA